MNKILHNLLPVAIGLFSGTIPFIVWWVMNNSKLTGFHVTSSTFLWGALIFIIWFWLGFDSFQAHRRTKEIRNYIAKFNLSLSDLPTITGLDKKYFTYGASANKISVNGYKYQRITLNRLQKQYGSII